MKALGTSKNGAAVQEISGVEWSKKSNGYIIFQKEIKFAQSEFIEIEPEFFYLVGFFSYLYYQIVFVGSLIVIGDDAAILRFWPEKNIDF
jgi:hypothetical protein